MTWSGVYFDGKTALRRPVAVSVMASGLRLATGEGTFLWWPYEDLRLAQGALPGEQIRIERGPPPPEALAIPDEAFLDAIRALAPRAAGHLLPPIRRRHWMRLVLLAGAAAVAAGLVLYAWGIPALAGLAARAVPRALEERLGQAVLESVAPPSKRCADPRRDAALGEILSRLSTADPAIPYTFSITVVDEPSVNAFAAPGGYLIIHLGLLRKTQSPEEMAGVLAHEMQHVRHRHGTRSLFREISTRALLGLLVGDASGLAQALEAARTLGALRYRRQDEEAADRDGMSLLQAASIDPGGMIGFLRRLDRDGVTASPVAAYLSTHPPTVERIRRLEQMAEETRYAPVALLPGFPWREVGFRCMVRP